jgi:hypothetical protein
VDALDERVRRTVLGFKRRGGTEHGGAREKQNCKRGRAGTGILKMKLTSHLFVDIFCLARIQPFILHDRSRCDLSFISSIFIGDICFHPDKDDWLSTLIGLVFGIVLGFLSNKLARTLSKPVPKSEGKESAFGATDREVKEKNRPSTQQIEK